MEERMHAVHDHIASLMAEADAERIARSARPGRRRRLGLGLRQRAGRALVALGALVEGPPVECETCPDGSVAAGGA
jgi:hypothetical protein